VNWLSARDLALVRSDLSWMPEKKVGQLQQLSGLGRDVFDNLGYISDGVDGLFVVSFGPGGLLLYCKKPYFLKLFLAKGLFFTPVFYIPSSQRHKPRA
jgi:hypothetical protein